MKPNKITNHYDTPTRIQEIIKENLEAYQWQQYLNKLITQKIGKEKIIKMKQKRWKEYLKKHEYKTNPTQEYY